MKNREQLMLIIVGASLLCGCSKTTVEVVHIMHHEKANDGVVSREPHTIVECQKSRRRDKWYGEWGTTGEVFSARWVMGDLLP